MEQTKDQEKKYCRNCNHHLTAEAKYCSQCSQKYSTGKIAIWSFFKEFFTTIFNFDSKIVVTLRDILIPGKLTKQYFKGKHKTYLHPLRLFLVTALVHFAIIGFYMGSENAFKTSFLKKNEKEQGINQGFLTKLDSNRIAIAQDFDNPSVNAAFDSLILKIEAQFPHQDSINISYDFGDNDISNSDLRISYKDYTNLSPDQLLDKYEVKTFWDRLLTKQFIKIRKRGENFGSFIFDKLTWMTLLMMPMLALMLKLLYIRRKRYYVEHLVFSFHYHSFAFILVSILTIFSKFLPDWFFALSCCGILVYLFIAMQRVYQQGKFKTFLKFCILNLSYLVLFILFLALTFVVGFFLF